MEQHPHHDRSRRARAWVVAVGAATGMTLAGLGISAAQVDDSREPAPVVQAADHPAPDGAPGDGRHKRGHGRGMHLGGALHGEFVARHPEGGFRTMAMQRGEVTDVSATSMTVKSEDGYSRTYVVDGDTKVGRGDGAIGDIERGDKVGVVAEVDGDTATARHIHEPPKDRPARPARPAERDRPARPAES